MEDSTSASRRPQSSIKRSRLLVKKKSKREFTREPLFSRKGGKKEKKKKAKNEKQREHLHIDARKAPDIPSS
jgi:hypothetical protein